jgi:hypothetical protein
MSAPSRKSGSSPRSGLGRIGTIRDPDGVKVELVERADLRDL